MSNNMKTVEAVALELFDQVEVVEPKVELVDSFNTIKDVWALSRPHLDPKDMGLDMLNRLDLPIHGFGQSVLMIEGTIAIRELFYLLRPSQCWAVSYRTIDRKITDMKVSSEITDPEVLSANRRACAEYIARSQAGEPKDLIKDLVPYGAMIRFMISLDWRTLGGVVNSLRRYDHLKIYADKIVEALPDEFESAVCMPKFDIFKAMDISDELKERDVTKTKLETFGNQVRVTSRIGGALHAQFIRKQYDKVYSEFPARLLDGSIYEYDQAEEYKVEGYFSKTSYMNLIATRTCWFAMFDKSDNNSWDYLLPEQSLEDFKKNLKCSCDYSKCVYREEQIPRIYGANTVDYDSEGEINPPCPLMVGLPGVIDYRKVKYNSDSMIMKNWEQLGQEMTPHKTDLTDEYIHNITNYGFAEKIDNQRKEEYVGLITKGYNK